MYWPGTGKPVQRLLIVRLDNIGDMVMMGPAIRSLRGAFKDAHLTLLATKAGAQIAPLLPGIDAIRMLRPVWQDVSGEMPLEPQRELALVDELRNENFDAAVIFTSFSQSPYPPAYACYLAGIPIRAAQSKEFGGSVLSHWIKPRPDETHQVDRNLHLVESLGLPLAGNHLELAIPSDVQVRADQLLEQAGLDPRTPWTLCAPGASCPSRTYERFGEVIRLLHKRTGMTCVVVGGPRERGLLAGIEAGARPAPWISLVGKTTIPELCGLIARCGLVLASHSGPMHIADALGRPMVILFSGTDGESQWRPRHAPHVLLNRPTPCAPCYLFRCRYQMECLAVPPEEVAARAGELSDASREGSADRTR